MKCQVIAIAFLVCAGLVCSGNTQTAPEQSPPLINDSNENNVPVDLCDAYVCIGKSEAVSPEDAAASLSMNGFLAIGSTLPCANGQQRTLEGNCPRMPDCPQKCAETSPTQPNSCWSFYIFTTEGYITLQDQRVNGFQCAWSTP